MGVDAGMQTITANLNDATGTLAQATVTVQVAATPPTLNVAASPSAGLAPLTVTLTAAAQGPATFYQWDVDGNGTIDASGATRDSVTMTYTVPGLYLPIVTVTDASFNLREYGFFGDIVNRLFQLGPFLVHEYTLSGVYRGLRAYRIFLLLSSRFMEACLAGSGTFTPALTQAADTVAP